MSQFDPEPGERCQRVDDQSTAVTGDVITLVGIRLRLDRAVDADRVGDPLVLPPGVGLACFNAKRCVAERTADEALLHHSPNAAASRPGESAGCALRGSLEMGLARRVEST
jgi:hypothetical protein